MTIDTDPVRDTLACELRTRAHRNPPSRFAVYEILEDDSGLDGQIIAWGLAAPGNVDVHSVDPGMCGRLSSVEAVAFLFGEAAEIVWIDQEPPSA